VQLFRLRVFQFRNFPSEEITLSARTNLFCGSNGQGKTNLLEAVYLLGYGKSFRTATPRDCIMHGAAECRVEGWVSQGSLERKLGIEISAQGKKLQVHGKEAPIEDFIGNLHLLAFTNEHLHIVRGGPAERRAFLDRGMVTLYPAHVRHLASYSRALKQRNRVLAGARDQGTPLDENLLSSWEETLVRDGARIAAHRMDYAAQMKENLPAGLFGAEILRLRYVSMARVESGDAGQMEELLRQKLTQARDADMRSGYTSVGPHRDELKLYINGKSLAEFGSAGQQRSALLSLYFAQMEIHRRTHGFYPLFLVDDAEAELDDHRLKSFLAFLSERTQTILTTARTTLIASMPPGTRRFEIHEGTARAVEPPTPAECR
jgi:DNA replication and repair protein RecF